MGQTALLRIIQDRFVAGHDSCELRRNTIEHEHEELPCESGDRLRQLDFTDGMDTGDGVHWAGSEVLNIFSNFGPSPERSFPGSGGIMKFPEVADTMDTGPGNVSP